MKDREKLQCRQQECRREIIDATISLIKREGVDAVSVRSVCAEANISTGSFYYYFKNKDVLLLSFIMEESFDGFKLRTPLAKIADRVTELYSILVKRYLAFGKDFMKQFYSPANTALSAYLCETNGAFMSGTIMNRCEAELRRAIEQGVLPSDSNAHQMSADVCTIVKGAVFEYCLAEKDFDVLKDIRRILRRYFA